jgi:ribosomal protein S18 acetylase RimI-like enzyme
LNGGSGTDAVGQGGGEDLTIRPFEGADVAWAERLIGAAFGGRLQARLGAVVDALACPGIVAQVQADPVGLLTYWQDDRAVEIVYLQASVKQMGIGSRLVEAVAERTRAARLWLVTTNDNLDALRFYQRRGFTIAEIRPGAVDEARRTLKSTIPEIGHFGIPVRDEIVLERFAPC